MARRIIFSKIFSKITKTSPRCDDDDDDDGCDVCCDAFLFEVKWAREISKKLYRNTATICEVIEIT